MNLLRWIALHRRAYMALSMLLALLAASFVAWQTGRGLEADRELPLVRGLGSLASTLEGGTTNSRAMGAAILFGLEHDEVKQAVRGKLAPDSPDILSGMDALRRQFSANTVSLMNAQGIVVAHSGKEDRTGRDLSALPYAKLAMLGTPSVYPAMDASDRGIYLAAPVRSTADSKSRPIGAVVVEVGANKLDMVLDGWTDGIALLLSPGGEIFSSSRDWVPRQAVPQLVPGAPEADIAGERYAVHGIPLEWHDPAGAWQLVVLNRKMRWWQDGDILALAVMTGLIVALGLFWLYSLARHERELQASDSRLRESQRIARLGSYSLNTQTGLFELSDETYRLFGIDETYDCSIAGWMALIHPEDLAMMEHYFNDEVIGRQEKIFDKEYRILRHDDGTERWLHGLGMLEYDDRGRPVKMSGTVQDITEQKRLAQQLEAILKQSPTGVAVFDCDGPVVIANEAYAELIGASHAEALQQDFRNNASWRRNGLLDFANQAFKTNSTIRHDIEGVTSFGKRVALECIFAPIRLSGRQHLLLLVNDVQERVEAQRALRESMRQLEQKELSKTRFLAAAGHDLRQPIAAANLYVDALKHAEPTPRQEELIQRLEQSMDVFSGLLECLLDISKLDAGLIKPQLASFDLTGMFEWLDQNFSQVASEKRLRFNFFFPGGRPLIVRTDADLLRSVMMNLVSNAIKFTTRGGILVAARPRGDHVLLQVWDTGPGIAKAHLPYIFDEFYQVSNPQRDREAGLGLGLSSCQRRMALLGGRVACRSRLGRGSVFELSLPLDDRPAEIVQAPAVDAQPADASFMSGKRVVVLEDDRLISEAMRLLLGALGADVRIFHSAEEALQQEDIGNADYFIVDHSLCGKLSGLHFLESIQGQRQDKLRAVILTGETSSHFLSSVADSPWPVMNKPVSIAALAARLAR
jgi:PAS domain S-box-containing protein